MEGMAWQYDIKTDFEAKMRSCFRKEKKEGGML